MSRSRAGAWLVAFVVGVMCSSAIFSPWVDAGFDLEDFSEFVPLLQAGGGVGDQFTRLVTYYADQGRWNIAVYGALVAKWQLLGATPIAWQWLRVTELVVLACLFAGTLRAFQYSKLAAGAAASMLLATSAGAASFQRMTLSEPLAVCTILVAMLVALRYQETRHWRPVGVGLAVLCFVLIAVKEVLFIGVVPVCILAMTWRRRMMVWPRWSRRERWLVTWVAVALVAASLPVLASALTADGMAYVSDYDLHRVSATRVGRVALWTALPVQAVVPRPDVLIMYPANVLALVLSTATVIVVWRRRDWPAGARMVALYAAPALTAGLLYSPWPRFEPFYALPFCLGAMAVFGASIDAAALYGKTAKVAVAATAVVAIAYAAVPAHGTTAERMAHRALMSRVVAIVADEPTGGQIVIETPQGSSSWQALAATVGRVAGTVNSEDRSTRVLAAKCGEGQTLAGVSQALVLSVAYCASSWGTGIPILVERYMALEWTSGAIRADSAFIGISRTASSGTAFAPNEEQLDMAEAPRQSMTSSGASVHPAGVPEANHRGAR